MIETLREWRIWKSLSFRAQILDLSAIFIIHYHSVRYKTTQEGSKRICLQKLCFHVAISTLLPCESLGFAVKKHSYHAEKAPFSETFHKKITRKSEKITEKQLRKRNFSEVSNVTKNSPFHALLRRERGKQELVVSRQPIFINLNNLIPWKTRCKVTNNI